MYRIITALAFCFMILTSAAQNIPVRGHVISPVDAPPGVENLFLEAFPGVHFVQWYSTDRNFVADFQLNDLQYYALFTFEGRQVELVRPVMAFELPIVVRQAIDEGRFNMWHVENITRVHLPGDEIFYRYRLSLDERVISVEVGEEGIIREVADW